MHFIPGQQELTFNLQIENENNDNLETINFECIIDNHDSAFDQQNLTSNYSPHVDNQGLFVPEPLNLINDLQAASQLINAGITHTSSSCSSNRKRLAIYYQNVRGLQTKTTDLKLSSTGCSYDAIALTETGLNFTINDGELFDDDFCTYRCDRSELNSIHERFGGVLIAVKSCIPIEKVMVPRTENVELVLVKLQFHKANTFICCLYIPSGSPVSVYHQYTEALERVIEFVDLNVEDKFYVLGDFNMPKVSWIADSDCADSSLSGFSEGIVSEPNALLPYNVDSGAHSELLYCLMGSGMSQVNDICNFQGNVLDLVFTNDPGSVVIAKSVLPLVRVDSFHDPIEIEFEVETDDVVDYNPDEHEYNFRKAKFDELDLYLSSIDWDRELSGCADVDLTVDRFYELLMIGFEQHVPLKKRVANKHPPWYSKTLLNLKNRMSRAHKRYKDIGTFDFYIKFCSLRNQLDAKRSRAYQSYLDTTQENLISDPSKFWAYVNSIRKTVGFPSFMHRGENRTTNMQGKCDLFAEFFKDVFVNDTGSDSQNFGLNKCVDIGSISLDKERILEALKKVDTGKGDGPDNISPLLLKNCSEALSSPLLRIFNLSLGNNFPTRWKESYVVPIYKSGSRSNVESYRGVAILPTFGKLFESIVCEILTENFKDVISLRQHGFVKGRSTSTNLVDFVNEAVRVIEERHQVDAVFTDVKKAFDRVRHSSLICKLKELGMHSSMLHWIRSYLQGRSQYVKLTGWKSESFAVTSGIPQGSHLGPLLFLIFFNDVTRVIKTSKCSLYADDLKVYHRIKSVGDCLAMQRDLDALHLWSLNNSLMLNIGKCNVMSFFRKRNPIRFGYTFGGVELKRIIEKRDLGVTLTENLSFNRHMECIVAKAYSMLGFIKRICKNFRNVEALKSIYFAHVRSHLEYASVVWSPYYQVSVDRIESVQKNFLIYALRRTVRRGSDFSLPPYLTRCKSIGIETLSRRRLNLCALFVFDILRGRIKVPSLFLKLKLNEPIRVLRTTNHLLVDVHRTNYGSFEPINNMSRTFNLFSHLYNLIVSRHAFRLAVRSMVLTDSVLQRHGFHIFDR